MALKPFAISRMVQKAETTPTPVLFRGGTLIGNVLIDCGRYVKTSKRKDRRKGPGRCRLFFSERTEEGHLWTTCRTPDDARANYDVKLGSFLYA